MLTFVWNTLSTSEKQTALARPSDLTDRSLFDGVRAITDAVRDDGDAAVRLFTQKYDRVTLSTFSVPKENLEAAWKALPEEQKTALTTAKTNIETFHTAQIPNTIKTETMPGVFCRREARAIGTVGLYVPGGTAPLVSTVLMLAVPAKVAGVSRRVMATPPGPDGTVNQAILAAAYLCGVTDVFVIGGAQAIAAMAFGTETVPRCDKIFGPGNAYVAAAKAVVSSEPGGPGIDLPAGPSEAMVIADDSTNPVFAAADLLSQAEHDTMSQVICVASSETVAKQIKEAVTSQIQTLPRRDIAEKSMQNGRMIIAAEDLDILEIVNTYGPEHLIIQTDIPEKLVPEIRNAGSLFLGHWTPESVGDYASGTNHTLPTYGAAKAFSGVTTESFMTYMSVQKLSLSGLEKIGPTVETLADMESLEAHRRAVSLRLERAAL